MGDFGKRRTEIGSARFNYDLRTILAVIPVPLMTKSRSRCQIIEVQDFCAKRSRQKFFVEFPLKKMISLANQLTASSSITIVRGAEEIHSTKAHVVDRRRIVKRGH
jgi:hypothetical protein